MTSSGSPEGNLFATDRSFLISRVKSNSFPIKNVRPKLIEAITFLANYIFHNCDSI